MKWTTNALEFATDFMPVGASFVGGVVLGSLITLAIITHDLPRFCAVIFDEPALVPATTYDGPT